MIDYGISFTSKETALLHAFMHFPASSDTKAYHDAIPPKDSQHHIVSPPTAIHAGDLNLEMMCARGSNFHFFNFEV
jgi:hypothetical protein